MISAILLGAGQSKRMGTNKLSLPWGEKTILQACLDSLLGSEAGEVIVVVNKGIQKLITDQNEKLKVVANPHFRKGMSTSIRRGLKLLRPGSRGILIALADQPDVRTRTINALIRAFVPKKGAIVVPTWQGRRGNPVIFDRSYEKELSKLRGDVGAKSILDRYPDRVIRVRTHSEAVVRDIDLWEEYVKLSTLKGPRPKARGFRGTTRSRE
jgi:molybdenum cofactor cytidylyltransferase